MVETSLILSLAIPAFLLIYTAFSFSEQHSNMRMLFAGAGMTFMLGIPFTGYKIALSQGYSEIAQYLIYFELAFIMVHVTFVFYLIWLYIKTTGLILSGTSESFDDDEI